MLRKTLVVALVVASAIAGILDECINLDYRDGWLVGDCLSGSETQRINSAVFLSNKFVNSDGRLQWQAKITADDCTNSSSGGYSTYCRDCKVSGVTFLCTCRPNFGDYRPTSINIEERISNYAGYLLSNITNQNPKPPNSSSTVPVPKSIAWDLIVGQSSCATPDFPEYSACNEAPSPNPADCSGSFWRSTAPYDCFTYMAPSSLPMWMLFQSLNPTTEDSRAWEFEIFGDAQCGKKLGKAPTNACTKFKEYGWGVSAKPLFNADWRV